MAPDSTPSVTTRLETLVALARLLERIENSPAPIGAEQYRALIQKLKAALAAELPAAALEAVLGSFPATAELYENMHYAVSGLSRSSLDRSVATEMLASGLMQQAFKGTPRA